MPLFYPCTLGWSRVGTPCNSTGTPPHAKKCDPRRHLLSVSKRTGAMRCVPMSKTKEGLLRQLDNQTSRFLFIPTDTPIPRRSPTTPVLRRSIGLSPILFHKNIALSPMKKSPTPPRNTRARRLLQYAAAKNKQRSPTPPRNTRARRLLQYAAAKAARNKAATKIQAAARGMRNRKVAAKARKVALVQAIMQEAERDHQRIIQRRAATKIQAAARGMRNRKVAAKARKVALVQAIMQEAERDHQRIVQRRAATKIQAAARGMRNRKVVAKARKDALVQAIMQEAERDHQRIVQRRAATKIQAAARGMRNRKVAAKARKDAATKDKKVRRELRRLENSQGLVARQSLPRSVNRAPPGETVANRVKRRRREKAPMTELQRNLTILEDPNPSA
jgi:hypothetical protein